MARPLEALKAPRRSRHFSRHKETQKLDYFAKSSLVLHDEAVRAPTDEELLELQSRMSPDTSKSKISWFLRPSEPGAESRHRKTAWGTSLWSF